MDTPDLLHGFELSLSYDSSVLEYVNVTRGNIFNGQPIFWWRVNTDTLNTVRVTCIVTGQAYTMGPGTLLNFTFNAQMERCTQISVAWMKHFVMEEQPYPVLDLRPSDVFIGTQVSYGKIKAFLQGPFDDGGMSTSLNPLLPLSSPYLEDPISVAHIPPDVVDWVLLELSSEQGGAPLYYKSLWMDKRGNLRIPGMTLFAMPNSPTGPYFVKLRHRNHVSISSAQAFLLSTSGVPSTLDMSLAANILAPGTAVEVVPGVMAMTAGDADQNGMVGNLDRALYWRSQAGKNGYLLGDFDMDGNVFPNDLNALWRPNLHALEGRNRTEQEATIFFHLQNPRLQKQQNDEYLWLDVFVSAEPGECELGTGMLLLEYSQASFGENIVSQGRLDVVPGALLADEYGIAFNFIYNDNQPNLAAIVFEYTGSVQSPQLTHEKVCLMQIGIKLEELSSDLWLAFSSDLMQGQQYLQDNFTTFVSAQTHDCELVFAPRNLCIQAQNGLMTLSWEQIPGYFYNVYSTDDPVSGEWNPESAELMDTTWTESASQNRKFYIVTGTKMESRP